jgi:hypothetical protein
MYPSTKTGFAIALAWPQTYCKQSGSWYDLPALFLGINKNNYYKVGHAALVLINSRTSKAYYFDFGRYHAPYQHGRVRSAETDHDLEIRTIPKFSANGGEIANYQEILNELQNNPACHGEGALYASYCAVDFEKAFAKANQMQDSSPIPYGPFKYKATNCSRFVSTVILAGNPVFRYRFGLKYLIPFTPSPLSNVNSLDNKLILPKLLKNVAFKPTKKLEIPVLKSTLPQPEKHPSIPGSAKWLSGEGAGSWFALEFDEKLLKVKRFSPDGIVECSGIYSLYKEVEFPIETSTFSIDYPSDCKKIVIYSNNRKLRFERISG